MGIGIWQVVLILVIVLIIFGAGKLPRVAGDLAKGIKNFKSGMSEDQPQDAGNSEQVIEKTERASEPAPEKDKAAQS